MGAPPVIGDVLRRLPGPVRSMLLHARGDFAPWEEGFDFTPPAPGAGETCGAPDFVGVGVQKAGTSWWYELILDHPGVHDPAGVPKERHYLSRFCVEPFGPAEVDRYHRWFPRVAGTIAGEWTPDYLGYPWVAPLLATAAPDARILVLLRDPVERFVSGLTFRLAVGAPHTSATVADAVRQGFYARQLRRLLDWFPPGQVLVQQYERCRADPAGELARTYEFLGLDPFVPGRIGREVNVSRRPKIELDGAATARLADLYRPDLADLARVAPTLDLGLWPSASGIRTR